MSETVEYQRLDCVCGKKLRIPNNAFLKAKRGKCPKCEAPFEYRNGQWICVASNSGIAVAAVASALTPSPGSPETQYIKQLWATADGNSQVLAKDSSAKVSIDVRPLTSPPATPAFDSTPPIASEPPAGDHRSADKEAKATPGLGQELHWQLPHASEATAADRNVTPTNLGIHQEIRNSLANALGLAARYPGEVASAITLACHPWPDVILLQNQCDAIAAELRPGFNINHPSVLEVAVDRLLRLSDAMHLEKADALVSLYFKAAETIDAHASLTTERHTHGEPGRPGTSLIESPLGIGIWKSASSEVKACKPADLDSKRWEPAILGLLGAAIERGSRDIGLACGGEPTEVTVDQLAQHLGIELPDRLFDSHLDGLNDRARDILKTRTFRLGSSDTLVDVAARWNITRERVRQIEAKTCEQLLNRFGNSFKVLGKPSFARFERRIFRIAELYETASRIAVHSRNHEILAGLLVTIFGPWQTSGLWIYHQSLGESISALKALLVQQADAYGVIDGEVINDKCEGLFSTAAERDQFLTEEFGFGCYFGSWTNAKTMRCQVVAALRHIGRPATKEELSEMLNHPPQNITSILSSIAGVVRADRYRWGFQEWIEDAYDGIVGEIEQRIKDYNGSVPFHILVRDIPAQFDVAENSVRAYLASSAFVVENGMVRIATSNDYVARSPSKCSDAVRIGDRWGYRSLIYDRHLNGYSLGINFDVAYANGLRPGDDLVVPIDGHEFQVSLIWRSHNLNRLVDVGRISEFLLAQGYKAGETLILIPSREAIAIFPERDCTDGTARQFAQSMLLFVKDNHSSKDGDANGAVHDPLLELLGGN